MLSAWLKNLEVRILGLLSTSLEPKNGPAQGHSVYPHSLSVCRYGADRPLLSHPAPSFRFYVPSALRVKTLNGPIARLILTLGINFVDALTYGAVLQSFSMD